ncbi:hypothetical protein Tco_1159095 [Tanacetum coccineum]
MIKVYTTKQDTTECTTNKIDNENEWWMVTGGCDMTGEWWMVAGGCSTLREIIVLTSDSSEDNKGVSSEGPSITSIPNEGPSIARRSKEPIPKELLEWYGYDTIEDYLLVAKKPIPKVIFKSPILNKGCVLELANVETWDNIVKKYRMRTYERCADKLKGKRKVSC